MGSNYFASVLVVLRLFTATIYDITHLAEYKDPEGRRRDLYRITLRHGSVRNSEPQPRGTVEHVTVISGSVCLGPSGSTVDLSPGYYFRYPADVPHSYEAVSESTIFLLAIESVN